MRFILLLAIAFNSQKAFSQLEALTFGGLDDDFGTSFTQNEIGGWVLLSTERTHIDSSNQIVLRSIDSKGNLLWKKIYGDKHHDQGNDIERCSDGGYIVAGSTWDWGYGRLDAYVLKLDAYGELQWSKHLGGYHRDEAFAIKEVSTGGYIMAGFTKSDTPTSYGQMFIVRMDASGNQIWQKDIGGAGKDYAFDVVENAAGEFVIVGEYAGFHDFSTFEFTETNSDIYLVKLDENGNILWANQYGGTENELCYKLEISPLGGYYLLGSTQSYGNGSFDTYLLKIDESGNFEWSQTYGLNDVDYGRAMSEPTASGMYISGSTVINLNSTKTDCYLKKIDLYGNQIWHISFGGNESEYVYDIKNTSDGGVAIIGSTRSAGNGKSDGFFMKVTQDGVVDTLMGSSDPFIMMYPNPTSDYLTLYYQTGDDCFDFYYSVYNYSGDIVEKIHTQSKVVKIDVSKYAAGTYHLEVASSCAERVLKKFIVHQ